VVELEFSFGSAVGCLTSSKCKREAEAALSAIDAQNTLDKIFCPLDICEYQSN
jgi:hypothetical protein